MPEPALEGSHRRGAHPALQPGQASVNREHRAPQQHLPLLQLKSLLQHPQIGKPQAETYTSSREDPRPE